MRVAGRHGTVSSAVVAATGARPVMLVTFDVPFAPEAAAFAVDSAVESGQPLIVVNVAEVPILPFSIAMGYEYAGTDEVEDALRTPAELARSLAVDVRRLRVCSPRPVAALLEVVAEQVPGLLVVGADPARVRRRRYAKAVTRIRAEAPCLVWLPS